MYQDESNLGGIHSYSSLTAAIMANSAPATEALLAMGASPNEYQGSDYPLLQAIECSFFYAKRGLGVDTACVDLLLRHGADPNTRKKYNYDRALDIVFRWAGNSGADMTPLRDALAGILMDAGADPGKLSLHRAIEYRVSHHRLERNRGNLETPLVDLLLAHGADLAQALGGRTIFDTLFGALTGQAPEEVQPLFQVLAGKLVEAGADPGVPGYGGKTAFLTAREYNLVFNERELVLGRPAPVGGTSEETGTQAWTRDPVDESQDELERCLIARGFLTDAGATVLRLERRASSKLVRVEQQMLRRRLISLDELASVIRERRNKPG